MKFYITIFIFLFSSVVFASEERIVVNNDCPGKTIILRENAHQKDLLEAYFANEVLILERCYKYGGYFKCGSRDTNDPNFFKNAKINIEKYKLKILQYERLVNEIPELQEVTVKLLDFMKFDLFKAELLLNFYQTFDINILKIMYNDLQQPTQLPPFKTFTANPTEVTFETFDELLSTIDALEDNFQKYHFAKYYWSNSINREYHNQYNPPSYEATEMAWKKFAEKYNIIEEYDNSNCD